MPITLDEQRAIEHAQKIATPSRLGLEIGKELWGVEYVIYPFIEYMEERILDAVFDEEDRFLMVNLPPQCGKTSYAGVLLAFWLVGMFPDRQVIFISYSDSYSTNYGRVVRDLMKRYGKELFGVEVDPNADAAGDWKLVGHPAGGMLSVGIGSQITGRSGHFVLIDDVIKNWMEAQSLTVKKAHLAEWDGTILPRRQPGCMYLITATRWADDDLSGSLQKRAAEPTYIANEGDKWEVIEFPAIAEPTREERLAEGFDEEEWRDPLGRKIGDPLQCRFDRPGKPRHQHHFYKMRASADQFAFSCLYQQRPTSLEGGMFPESNWRYYEDLPTLERKVRVWDLASTENAGDWTVGTLIGRDAKGDFYIVDRKRFRKRSEDVRAEVVQAAEVDGYDVTVVIEQERSGAGASVLDFYRTELVGYTLEAGKAETSKESRATPYSSYQQARRVWLPKDAPWLQEWIVEHNGMMGDGRRPTHDDQIDTAAYGVLHLLDTGPTEIYDFTDAVDGLAEVLDIAAQLGMQVHRPDERIAALVHGTAA